MAPKRELEPGVRAAIAQARLALDRAKAKQRPPKKDRPSET